VVELARHATKRVEENSGAFANASPAHDRLDLHETRDEQGRSG
jgi:hypothetical protein